MIPVNIGVPGAKLGLANLAIIVALYTLGERDAFLLSVVRIVLVGFTFANLAMMIYSLAGGCLSYAAWGNAMRFFCQSCGLCSWALRLQIWR